MNDVELYLMIVFGVLLFPYRDKPTYSFSVKGDGRKDASIENLKKKAKKNSLIEQKVKDKDENFDGEHLISWVKNMFLKYQIAYENEEWNSLMPFLTENLIQQTKKRKNANEESDRKKKFERINNVELISFETGEEKEFLKVKVYFYEMLEVYDLNGNLIKGLTKSGIPKICTILLEREKGHKTQNSKKNTQCPNCGAPTHVVTNGRCKFCGEVIQIEKENWKWSDMYFNDEREKELEAKLLELKKQGISQLIRNKFLQIQEAINEHNIEKLISLETDLLLERTTQNIHLLEHQERKQVRKDAVIDYVDVYLYERDNEYERVSALIQATLEDYIYESGTGRVVEGVKDYKVTKKYKMIIKRKCNFEKNENLVKCHNCGAMVTFNAVGKCNYCGNMLYSDEYNWVVEVLDEM